MSVYKNSFHSFVSF